jgi:hypothetical protein
MYTKMDQPESVISTIITLHACDRAKQRLQWGKATLQRMADKAFREGLCHHQSTGQLKKYLNKLWLEQKKADNLRIYGQHVFLFAGQTLLTVWQVPCEFRKVSDKLLVRYRTALRAA